MGRRHRGRRIYGRIQLCGQPLEQRSPLLRRQRIRGRFNFSKRRHEKDHTTRVWKAATAVSLKQPDIVAE